MELGHPLVDTGNRIVEWSLAAHPPSLSLLYEVRGGPTKEDYMGLSLVTLYNTKGEDISTGAHGESMTRTIHSDGDFDEGVPATFFDGVEDQHGPTNATWWEIRCLFTEPVMIGNVKLTSHEALGSEGERISYADMMISYIHSQLTPASRLYYYR